MFEITIIFIQTDDIAYNQTVTEALNFLLGFLMNFIQIIKKIFSIAFQSNARNLDVLISNVNV